MTKDVLYEGSSCKYWRQGNKCSAESNIVSHHGKEVAKHLSLSINDVIKAAKGCRNTGLYQSIIVRKQKFEGVLKGSIASIIIDHMRLFTIHWMIETNEKGYFIEGLSSRHQVKKTIFDGAMSSPQYTIYSYITIVINHSIHTVAHPFYE
jgi:hypothetical protein